MCRQQPRQASLIGHELRSATQRLRQLGEVRRIRRALESVSKPMVAWLMSSFGFHQWSRSAHFFGPFVRLGESPQGQTGFRNGLLDVGTLRDFRCPRSTGGIGRADWDGGA
jgi:hypothetical protein